MRPMPEDSPVALLTLPKLFLAGLLAVGLGMLGIAAAQDGPPPKHEHRERRGPREEGGPDRNFRQQMRRLIQLRIEGERIAATREARLESERELADTEQSAKRGAKWIARQQRLNTLRAEVETIEVEDYLERVQRETTQTLARIERRRAELEERGEDVPEGFEWHQRRLADIHAAASTSFDALMEDMARGPGGAGPGPESERLERLAEERLFIMRRLTKLNEELGFDGPMFKVPPGALPPDERSNFPGAGIMPPRAEMTRDRGRRGQREEPKPRE